MENKSSLVDLTQQELLNIEGGGIWRDIGRAIGRWLDSINDGTDRGCGDYNEIPIMGDNFVS